MSYLAFCLVEKLLVQRVAGTRGSAQLQPQDGLSRAGSGELGERLLAPSRSAFQLSGLGYASGEPLVLRGITAKPPMPGRDGAAQPGPSPSCQRWLPEEHLQYFPFTSAYEALILVRIAALGRGWGLPRAIPRPSRFIPMGCAKGTLHTWVHPCCSGPSSAAPPFPLLSQRTECGAFKNIFVPEYILH